MRLDEHFLVSPTIIEAVSGSEALSVSKKAPSKVELPDGVLCRVSYPICAIGKRNANNRVYEKAVWDKVLAQDDIKRKLENRALFGHAEHPEQTQSNLEKTCHVIFEMWQDNGTVWQTLDVLDTPTGRIVDCLLRAGCKVGMSTRAEGDLEEAEDGDGSYHNVVAESYSYETTDFTADPSTSSALPHNVKFKVVEEIKKASEMQEATKSEKEFASRVLESMKCEGGTICEHCGACNMDKNTVESLVKAKTIVVESELTYGDKSAKVAEINEQSIILNVADTDGTSVQVNIDGETNVNIDQAGAISIVPVPAEATNADLPVEEMPMDPANTGMGMPAVDTEEEMSFECKGCGTTYGKAEQLDENGKCEICSAVIMRNECIGKFKVGEKIIMLEDGEHKDKEGRIQKVDETSMDILLDDGTLVAVDNPEAVHVKPVAAKEVDLSPEETEPEVSVEASADESPCPDEEAPMEDLVADEDMDEKIPAEAGISDKLASGNLLQDKNGVAWIVKSADDGALTVTQPGEPGSEKRIPWDEADGYGFTKLSESKVDEKVVQKDGKWYVESESGKNLGGPYDSRAAANQRLRDVEFYKSNESTNEEVIKEKDMIYAHNLARIMRGKGKNDEDIRKVMTLAGLPEEDIESVVSGSKDDTDESKVVEAKLKMLRSDNPFKEGDRVQVAHDIISGDNKRIYKTGSTGVVTDVGAESSLVEVKFDEDDDRMELNSYTDIDYIDTSVEETEVDEVEALVDKESTSENIVKDLIVKEAATRAERDKAIELLEELESKDKVKEGKAFEVKILVKKINETLQAKEKEEKDLRLALEAKAKLVSDLTKQVAEYKELATKAKTEMNESVLNSQTVASELKESISVTEQKHAKALKALKEKHEKALTEAEKKYHDEVGKAVSEAEEMAKKNSTKEFITSFVEYKLSETNSNIGDNSRALLEDCKSIEEVEELLEDVMDARRRNALHSEPISGIKVVKHEVVNEEHKEAERSVSEAFKGMSY